MLLGCYWPIPGAEDENGVLWSVCRGWVQQAADIRRGGVWRRGGWDVRWEELLSPTEWHTEDGWMFAAYGKKYWNVLKAQGTVDAELEKSVSRPVYTTTRRLDLNSSIIIDHPTALFHFPHAPAALTIRHHSLPHPTYSSSLLAIPLR